MLGRRLLDRRLFGPRLFAALVCAFGCWGIAGADEQAQVDFANGLFGRGFFAEAADEYRAYLGTYPAGSHRDAVLYRLGESEHASGNYEAAIETFDRVLESDASLEYKHRALLRGGVARYHLKRFEAALETLTRLLGESPAAAVRGEALYYVGKLRFDAGQRAEAIRAFRSLIDSDPEGPLVAYGRYQLAYVFLAQADLDKAASEFLAVSEAAGAGDDLRVECRFRAAEIYDKLGWFDAAVQAYDGLARDFPASEYSVKAAYGHAWALYHSGKTQRALASVEEILEGDFAPSIKAGASYLRGNALQQSKRHDDALRAYGRLREEYPDSDFALRARYKTAWVLYLQGHAERAEDEARAFLLEAGSIDLSGDAAFLLGTIRWEAGDYLAALEHYDRIVEAYGSSEFASEAAYRRGECLRQLGRLNDAAAAFTEFAVAFPDDPLAGEAVLRAGDAEFSLGNFVEAAGSYRRVLDSEVSDGVRRETLYRLGLAHHNAGDGDASVATFRRLVEDFPESAYTAEALFRIGNDFLQNRGDPVEAIRLFEQSYDADPEGSFAGRALKSLALARYETKDYDGAADVFSRVIREHGEIALGVETAAWVGEYQYDREAWAETAGALEYVLSRFSNYSGADAARFRLADAYEHLDKTAAAIAEYENVLDGTTAGALADESRLRLAGLYVARGDGARALDLLTAASSSSDPDMGARASFQLAELLESEEKLEDAAKSFMRVAILYVHETLSPESMWRAAQCYERLGRGEDARKTYDELVREYPDHARAAEARGRIDSLGGA